MPTESDQSKSGPQEETQADGVPKPEVAKKSKKDSLAERFLQRIAAAREDEDTVR